MPVPLSETVFAPGGSLLGIVSCAAFPPVVSGANRRLIVHVWPAVRLAFLQPSVSLNCEALAPPSDEVPTLSVPPPLFVTVTGMNPDSEPVVVFGNVTLVVDRSGLGGGHDPSGSEVPRNGVVSTGPVTCGPDGPSNEPYQLHSPLAVWVVPGIDGSPLRNAPPVSALRLNLTLLRSADALSMTIALSVAMVNTLWLTSTLPVDQVGCSWNTLPTSICTSLPVTVAPVAPWPSVKHVNVHEFWIVLSLISMPLTVPCAVLDDVMFRT